MSTLLLTAYACLSAETTTIFLLAIVSGYTFRAVCSTSLLHWNLKALYVAQTVVSCAVYGPCRLYCIITWRLFGIDGSSYGLGATTLERAGPYFAVTLSTYLTPLLICERIVATRFVSSYEASKRPYVIVGAMAAVVGVSVAVNYPNSVPTGRSITLQLNIFSALNLVATALLLFVCAGDYPEQRQVIHAAIQILIELLRYNERTYDLAPRAEHTLTERYQACRLLPLRIAIYQ